MHGDRAHHRPSAMRTARRALAVLAALYGVAATALPATALAEVPASPSSVAPPAGAMRLTWSKVGGKPLFTLVGARIVVHGTVTPYVAGQSVDVGFYLDGRK